jgi:hypothetical protein
MLVWRFTLLFCAALGGLPGATETGGTAPLPGTASAPAAARAPTRAISGAINDVGDSAEAGTGAMSAFGGAIDMWMCIVAGYAAPCSAVRRNLRRSAYSALRYSHTLQRSAENSNLLPEKLHRIPTCCRDCRRSAVQNSTVTLLSAVERSAARCTTRCNACSALQQYFVVYRKCGCSYTL